MLNMFALFPRLAFQHLKHKVGFAKQLSYKLSDDDDLTLRSKVNVTQKNNLRK